MSNGFPRAEAIREADDERVFTALDEGTRTFKPGYHLRPIVKGVLGEVSKIREEVEELEDAHEQGVVIMELVELSDLYGAMKARVEKLGHTMQDLERMSAVTARAFQNGKR
jgi:hypothetical protein